MVDKAHQFLSVAQHHSILIFVFLRRVLIIYHLVQRTYNERKRCFELVRDVREKIGFHLVDFVHTLGFQLRDTQVLLVSFLNGVILHDKHEQAHPQQGVEDISPSCSPKRRGYYYLNCSGFFAPHPIVVSGFYFKNVSPWVEVCISSDALGSIINPIAVKTFEHIGVLVFERSAVVQCRKTERYHRLPMFEVNALGLIYHLAEHPAFFWSYRFVEYLKIGNYYFGLGLVKGKLLRIESIKTVFSSNE